MKTTTKPTTKTKTVTRKRQSRGQLIPDLEKMSNAEIAKTVAAHARAYDAIRNSLDSLKMQPSVSILQGICVDDALREACENWRNIIDTLFASITYAKDRIEVSVTLTQKQTPKPKKA